MQPGVFSVPPDLSNRASAAVGWISPAILAAVFVSDKRTNWTGKSKYAKSILRIYAWTGYSAPSRWSGDHMTAYTNNYRNGAWAYQMDRHQKIKANLDE